MNGYEYVFFMLLTVVGLPTFIWLILSGLDYFFEEVPRFMEGLSEAAGPREPVLKPPSAEQSAVVPAAKP